MFTPTWGNDPICLIFFRRVETTNQMNILPSFPKLQELWWDIAKAFVVPVPSTVSELEPHKHRICVLDVALKGIMVEKCFKHIIYVCTYFI